MPDLQPAAILRYLESVRAETLRRFEPLTQEQLDWLPPPPPYGTSKEVIAYWFERARLMTRRLIESWPANPNLALKHTGGLEPMNGAEWLMGYGGHEAFHHRQLDALIAQAPQVEHV